MKLKSKKDVDPTSIKAEKEKEKKGMSMDSDKLKTYFNQKTFLGVALAGVLCLVGVYVFVYSGYTQKTAEIEASNKQLSEELAVLEEYYVNMERYKVDTETLKTDIGKIMEAYPADAREEDIIMLAVDMQQNNEISYTSIDMDDQEEVYTIPQDMILPAEIEGLTQSIGFMQKHATYVNETDYVNLKTCIEQIYASQNRIGIDNIVYVKDKELGLLEGTINLYFYSARGTDKSYSAPDITEYVSGTDDLFKLNGVVVEDAAGNESED